MFKNFKTRLKTEFKGYNMKAFGKDAMAGLTVTAVALPLALAFGESCGASAASGLVTAIIAGLIIGALSGASFQISGPTGAMSAILIGIVAQGGIQNVFVVSLLSGIIILLCAIFKLGRLVQMIPRPVITGFTSGIAIIIALGQIDNFFGTSSVGNSTLQKLMSYGKLGFNVNIESVLLGIIVIFVMIFWPKKWGAVIPGSLVGIIISTVVSIIAGFNVDTVGNIPKTLFLDNRLNITGINIKEIGTYISPAISIAALGIIESLLCGASASRMKNENFDADQELVAQGIGNIIIPFFGGVPATAAIARTSVAIKSGCQTRICGIVHALGLLASMFLLGPVMALLPLSALAGVLMVTAWRMNEWSNIKYIFGKRFFSACAEFLITMIATVVYDLTVAIIIGIIFSAIIYIIKSSKITINTAKIDYGFNKDNDDKLTHKNSYILYITGPIFFMNAQKLENALLSLPYDCKEVIVSFKDVPALDTTGVEVIKEAFLHIISKDVRLSVCNLNSMIFSTLKKGEVLTEDSKIEICEDIDKNLMCIK